MPKNWVKTANGTTITRAFKVTIEADADVDDLIKAIRTEAITLGYPIVVDRVLNCVGNNERASRPVNQLFHPEGNSEENPILFTEIIDPPVTAPSDGKKYIILYYP